MFRSLAAGVILLGLSFALLMPNSSAQEKKEPPKKRERIALSEPADVAKDPDFAIQGEYVGEVTQRREEKSWHSSDRKRPGRVRCKDTLGWFARGWLGWKTSNESYC